MSSIGPNIAASILGSVSGQQRAAETRGQQAADESRQLDRASFRDKLANEIGSDDLDAQVDSDAGGLGGQGRAFTENEGTASDGDTPADTERPVDGELDLQA